MVKTKYPRHRSKHRFEPDMPADTTIMALLCQGRDLRFAGLRARPSESQLPAHMSDAKVLRRVLPPAVAGLRRGCEALPTSSIGRS